MTTLKEPASRESAASIIIKQMLGSKLARKSWDEFKRAVIKTLNLMIESQIVFGKSDFAYIFTRHADDWLGDGEVFYAQAVENDNISACLSFEHWKMRPLFTYNGKRLYKGAEFMWQGKKTCIVSICKDYKGWHLRCTSGKPGVRFNITQRELQKGRPLPTDKQHRLLEQYIKVFDICESGREFISRCKTPKEVWQNCSNDELFEMKRLLMSVRFPIIAYDLDSVKDVNTLRCIVGDFDRNLLPLIEAEIKRRIALSTKRKRVSAECA